MVAPGHDSGLECSLHAVPGSPGEQVVALRPHLRPCPRLRGIEHTCSPFHCAPPLYHLTHLTDALILTLTHSRGVRLSAHRNSPRALIALASVSCLSPPILGPGTALRSVTLRSVSWGDGGEGRGRQLVYAGVFRDTSRALLGTVLLPCGLVAASSRQTGQPSEFATPKNRLSTPLTHAHPHPQPSHRYLTAYSPVLLLLSRLPSATL
ncbi:hypothetical protein B0T25DRAFT_526157 [Lasiosphaeria hispida]|uniref:Uncharacterized protein n=1 Tax=Lasiosphaeria hispida TaxID=260671 RepID=A0AAJ0HUS5_9PEZI|nr:hypothetical protein B0T25DRAFT_526157 [Lasiosphaeria hispida]